MSCHDKAGDERARRFRDAALPCLDDAYNLARFLMRNQADAEDAVQESYLRALRHFDSWRGDGPIKPWLLAIVRNVCYGEFERRGRKEMPVDLVEFGHQAEQPLWQEPPASPDAEIVKRQESAALRQLIHSLPAHFREALVLCELNDMSYREIAEVTGVPVGTVMSRLARARALLVWKAKGCIAQQSGETDLSMRKSLERVAGA
jgi:RNA polymerase sigma-70 factor (ECF subfamily)